MQRVESEVLKRGHSNIEIRVTLYANDTTLGLYTERHRGLRNNEALILKREKARRRPLITRRHTCMSAPWKQGNTTWRRAPCKHYDIPYHAIATPRHLIPCPYHTIPCRSILSYYTIPCQAISYPTTPCPSVPFHTMAFYTTSGAASIDIHFRQ